MIFVAFLAAFMETTTHVRFYLFPFAALLDGRLDAPVVQLFSAGKAPSHVVIGDRMQVGWALFPPTHRYPLREIARCPNARV